MTLVPNRRATKKNLALGVLAAALSSCAQPPPPPVAAVPPPAPSAFALRQAEEAGYEAGFEAGRHVQARHDWAVEAAIAAKANAATPNTEPQLPLPPVETGPPPPPPASAAPILPPVATAPATAAANGFNPSGPATPVGAAPPAF